MHLLRRSDVHKLPRRAVRRQLARQQAAQQRAGTAGASSVSRWVLKDTCTACGHTSKRLVQRSAGHQVAEQQGSKHQAQVKPLPLQLKLAEQQHALQQPEAASLLASPAGACAQGELAGAAATDVSDAVLWQQQQRQQQQQQPEAENEVHQAAACQEPKHKRAHVAAEGQAAEAVALLSTTDEDETPPHDAAPVAEEGLLGAGLGQDPVCLDAGAADSSSEQAAAATTEPAIEAGQNNAGLQEGAAAAEAAAAAASASSGEEEALCLPAGSEEQPAKRRRRLSWSDQLQDVHLIERVRKPKLKRILSWRRLARSWKPAAMDLQRLGSGSGL